MKTKLICALILGASLGVAFLISGTDMFPARAQETAISYPVAELGNCSDKAECKTYCDNPAHTDACVRFAEQNGLMSASEANVARKVASEKGPGGCTGKESCERYCDSMDHISECVAFAEKNGLMSGKEMEEAKKIAAALARGVQPPPCKNKTQCDAYCAEPSHTEVCITFALQAGLMDEKEQKNAQQMLQAVKKGITPPRCSGKDCDAYCQEESHFEECVNFAVAAGFMTQDEYEMAKKTGGKGPGGCRGEECKTFCDKPENQDTCFTFGVENGLIPADELKKMEEGKKQMMEAVTTAPALVMECMVSTLGADTVQKIKSGTFNPSKNVGEAMEKCFKLMPQGEGGPEGSGPNGQGMPDPEMMVRRILDSVPKELRSCMQGQIRPEMFSKGNDPREIIDRLARECAEKMNIQPPKQENYNPGDLQMPSNMEGPYGPGEGPGPGPEGGPMQPGEEGGFGPGPGPNGPGPDRGPMPPQDMQQQGGGPRPQQEMNQQEAPTAPEVPAPEAPAPAPAETQSGLTPKAFLGSVYDVFKSGIDAILN